MSRLRYILSILSIYNIASIFSQSICSFSPENKNVTFDLSGLHSMGKLEATDSSNDALTYHFTVCGNLTGDMCTTTEPGIGCAQQWTDGACTYWMATWTTPNNMYYLNTSKPTQGIVIELVNGEVCYKQHGHIYYMGVRYIFYCNKDIKYKVLSAQQDPHAKCIYELSISSYFVCPGFIPPGSDKNSSGFSTGLLIIILFFCIIILALLTYYVILGIKTKNWGKQSFQPPLNLCRYFWIYVCVGCKVSVVWTRNKIGKKGAIGYGSGSGLNDDFVDTDD